MHNLVLYALVAITGLLGVLVRFGVNFWNSELQGIILSTFVVNSIGSYFIGLFWELWQKGKISHEWYIIITGGFIGGLTTFSGYALNLVLLTKYATLQNTTGVTHETYVVPLIIYGLCMPFFGMACVIFGIASIS